MPSRSPAHRSVPVRLAAALLIVATGLGWAAMAGASRGTAPPLERPASGGVMVGWHEKGDKLDALRTHEAELGTRFAVVRVYQQWKAPSSKIGTLIDEGRLVVVSHKPPAVGGWAAVASGAEDAVIAMLADRYRDYGRQVVFSFHHEPHDDAVDVKGGTAGTAADYLAAWRRIHAVFVARGAHRSVGGDVHFAYSATGSWALAAAKGEPLGTADPLYPGSDIIDVLAHDRYNWASCRNDDWEEFSENWSPLVALAARLGKPLIIGEFGSAPAGGARNDWFRRAAQWMRTDPTARQWLWGFAYYHSLHDTCPWDFLNAPIDDGASGWRAAFADPYFSGAPFALPAGALAPVTETPPVLPVPPPPAPPTTLAPAPPTTIPTTPPTTTAVRRKAPAPAVPVAAPQPVPGPASAPPPAAGEGSVAAPRGVQPPRAGDQAGMARPLAEVASPAARATADQPNLVAFAPWILLVLVVAAVPLVVKVRT